MLSSKIVGWVLAPTSSPLPRGCKHSPYLVALLFITLDASVVQAATIVPPDVNITSLEHSLLANPFSFFSDGDRASRLDRPTLTGDFSHAVTDTAWVQAPTLPSGAADSHRRQRQY